MAGMGKVGFERESRAKNGAGRFLGGVFGTVGIAVYVMVIAGWCALIGMMPLILVQFVVPNWHFYPVLLVALALSTPGIAALFAVFRDQPVLFSRVAEIRTQAMDDGYVPPDWIAPSYVSSDAGSAFIRPYVRAYRRVWKRSLIQGTISSLLIFSVIYDAQIFSQTRWGSVIVPAMLVIAAMLIQALLVALVLVVEYPKAKWTSVFKNGFLLSIRRFYMVVVSALALGGYIWGLSAKPILVVLLATGLVGYIVWASARWQADKLFILMAEESGDERIVDMYTSAGKDTGRTSLFGSTADYRQ